MQKTLKEIIDVNVLISKNKVITVTMPLTRRVEFTGVAVRSLMVAYRAQIDIEVTPIDCVKECVPSSSAGSPLWQGPSLNDIVYRFR